MTEQRGGEAEEEQNEIPPRPLVALLLHNMYEQSRLGAELFERDTVTVRVELDD